MSGVKEGLFTQASRNIMSFAQRVVTTESLYLLTYCMEQSPS